RRAPSSHRAPRAQGRRRLGRAGRRRARRARAGGLASGAARKRDMTSPPSATVAHAAERLHEALKASHMALFGRIEGARIEARTGYLLLVCPPLPIAELNGVWGDDPGDEQSAVKELAGALTEVERLGLPCSVQARAGQTPA